VDLAAKTLRHTRARYVLAGWEGEPGTYTLRIWTTKDAIILTTHPSFSLDEMEDMRHGLEGVARGAFSMDRIVTHHFSLDDIQMAFERMLSGSDGYVKGVVVPEN
jgi:threonine dehydrogenase-like Zn-dependent dehydrogenase